MTFIGNPAFEQDNGFSGFDQTFILNCIASHNAQDLEREEGVSAWYSLIRSEPIPFGFGNISGKPSFAMRMIGIVSKIAPVPKKCLSENWP